MSIPRPDLSKLTHAEKEALIYALLDRIDRQEERIQGNRPLQAVWTI